MKEITALKSVLPHDCARLPVGRLTQNKKAEKPAWVGGGAGVVCVRTRPGVCVWGRHLPQEAPRTVCPSPSWPWGGGGLSPHVQRGAP